MEHLIKRIEQLLESPIGKALASDVAIVGGVEAFKLMLRAHRGTAQQGESNKAAAEEPSRLPDALLSLIAPPPISGSTAGGTPSNTPPVDIKEITSWVIGLPHAQRARLNKLKVDELKSLLRLPPDVRTQVMEAITEPTIGDGLERLKKWWEVLSPQLNQESRDILQEWKDWADEIIAKP